MTAQKILISDSVSQTCVTYLQQHGFDVVFKPGITGKAFVAEIGNADALIVRSATKVTADILNEAGKLRVIGRAGSGVDNIDLEAATAKGIAVLNTPGGNTISAAEHTFAMMISLARQVPAGYVSLIEGKWQRGKFIGVELYKKTLGIIGFGQIGREVAKRAQAFGMEVIAFDPLIATDVFESMSVRQVSVDEMLRNSDFITLHVPLNSHTKHMLGAEQFAISKPGIRIINVSRGGVIDEAALYDALQSGQVAGAALDVFEHEPPTNNPLFELDNVIATPHLGASTIDAQERVALQVATYVANFLQGKSVDSIVNPEVQKIMADVKVTG